MNQHRIQDLETALIFLREGLTRTKKLQALIEIGKAESPDIPCRIERIEGTIRRFENEIADYRTDEWNKAKQIEEDKKKAERAEKRAERMAEKEEKEEENAH